MFLWYLGAGAGGGGTCGAGAGGTCGAGAGDVGAGGAGDLQAVGGEVPLQLCPVGGGEAGGRDAHHGGEADLEPAIKFIISQSFHKLKVIQP